MYVDNIRILSVVWCDCMECRSVWDRDDLWIGVHRVCHSRGPKERKHWNYCTHCNWFHCGCQHLSWWCLWWCIHEPSSLLWPCCGQLVMGQPLGLLGWSTHWLRHRCPHLRAHLHQPKHPWTSPKYRFLKNKISLSLTLLLKLWEWIESLVVFFWFQYWCCLYLPVANCWFLWTMSCIAAIVLKINVHLCLESFPFFSLSFFALNF